MSRDNKGHTWGMSELEWYRLQAELISLERRKANDEKCLESLERNQREILWAIGNKRKTLQNHISEKERWIAEKEVEILGKMMGEKGQLVEIVKG